MDGLVEPKEECEVGVETDKLVSVPISGDAEIAAHVKHVIVVEGEIIKVDDSEDDNGENDLCAGLTFSDVMQMPVKSLRPHAGSSVTWTLPYHTSCIVSVASSGAWR